MYMRRMVMALAILVVVTEAAAGVHENNSGQRLDAIDEEMTGVAMRIASGEVTPLAAPTAAKAEETTSPTKRTPKVEPANEEKREETAAPQEQLDVDTLEKRLRQTDALGFFTKWALKNQVDDLLDRFRAYHTGKSNLTLEQLHERYNLLLLKLVSLLEDDDAQLSHDIFASRRAIWKVLADPEQFAKLQKS